MEEVAEFIESEYSGKVVEIGVGRQTQIAESLDSCDGIGVTVTDIDSQVEEDVSEEIEFVVDDVTDPEIEVYEDASVVYSVRPPYELQSALKEVAEAIEADLLLVPLADETPRDGFELLNYEGEVIYRFSPIPRRP